MNSEEVMLLPCPFCGAPGQIDDLGDPNDDSFACCSSCDAQLHAKYTREDACAAWNTRAASPSLPSADDANPKAPMPSQRAREAAADLHLEILGSPHSESDLFEAEGLRAGDLDNWPEVQAFVRFERDIAGKLANDVARLREALSASGETKYAYSGEFSWTEWLPDENGVEQGHERTVPWTVLKQIMVAILDRAGVEPFNDDADILSALSNGGSDEE